MLLHVFGDVAEAWDAVISQTLRRPGGVAGWEVSGRGHVCRGCFHDDSGGHRSMETKNSALE